MKLEVYNIEGGKTGRSIDLPEDIFGVETNEHAVYLSVKQYLANQRQGTHKTKERSELSGSRRKVKRQKGTGTARFGDIKNPIFRGGARVFGPRPRKYSVNVNKKVKQLARKSVLTDKAQAGKILVIEDFSFEQPQTKAYLEILGKLPVEGRRSVLVTGSQEKEVYLSSRNLKDSTVVTASDLNTYQILRSNTLILSEGAVDKIKETFA